MNKLKCLKCGFESENNKYKLGIPLCSVCFQFAPSNAIELDEYIEEKVSAESLTPLRKQADLIGNPQKKGMIQKASEGNPMSRPALGYEFISGQLIPAQNKDEVEEIFEEFLNTNLSLRKIAKKHNLSVNGLKKVLTNFTYIGKVKFNNQIYNGTHQPIISTTLFNHVQDKIERLRRKKSQ